MIAEPDSLLRARLDSLPAEELRRMAEPWCGTVPHATADSVANGVPEAAAHRLGAFTDDGFDAIVERWRRAREVFRDTDAADMFGRESSLAYGAEYDIPSATDSLSAADGIHAAADAVRPAADTVLNGSAEALYAGADTLRPGADSLLSGVDTLRPLAESASYHPGADTLRSLADNTLHPAADTLSAMADGLGAGAVPDTVSGVDPVSAVAAAVTGRGDAAVAAVAGEVLQNLLVAVVIFLYIFCLYRYFDDVKALFGSVFRRSVAPSERMIERRRSEIFYGFLGKLFLIGTCALGAIASLWAGRLPVWDAVPPYVHVALPFAVMISFLAVVVVQYAMLAVTGGITRSWPTMATLLRIRLIYFVLSTVLVMPLVLMWQLNAGASGGVWLRAACVAGVITVALYVRESVTLFISKKISILHWFLYLCTVEIMPVTLLWQIVVRMGM